MNNKPSQLEIMRKKSQDKLYKRQPQIMFKLDSLINRADLFIPKKSMNQNNNSVNSLPTINFPMKNHLREKISKISYRRINVNTKYKTKNKRVMKYKNISEIPSRLLWDLR